MCGRPNHYIAPDAACRVRTKADPPGLNTVPLVDAEGVMSHRHRSRHFSDDLTLVGEEFQVIPLKRANAGRGCESAD